MRENTYHLSLAIRVAPAPPALIFLRRENEEADELIRAFCPLTVPFALSASAACLAQMATTMPALSWGAYPGSTPEDIQSGVGVVRGTPALPLPPLSAPSLHLFSVLCRSCFYLGGFPFS